MKRSNALLIIFLTHGSDNDMIAAYDEEFHLYEIMKLFTPEELPLMATRPKIFLVNACRGKGTDKGAAVKFNNKVDYVDAILGGQQVIKYPSYADLIIGFSSHHGHYSFRNDSGSWYIQEFCNVLQTADLDKDDIFAILTKTNKKVAIRTSNSNDVALDDKKQISSVYSTLTKQFYFRRKYLNSETHQTKNYMEINGNDDTNFLKVFKIKSKNCCHPI